MRLMIAIVVALLGCSNSTSDSEISQVAASANQIRSYQELAGRIETEASDYASAVASPQLDSVQACQGIHDAYDARVRPRLSDMLGMGASMDRFMDERGGAASSDLQCAAEAMLDELDRHAGSACRASTLGADRTEAMRHSEAMLRYAGHVWDRCDEMMDAAASPAMWGPMMTGCHADVARICDGGHHWMGGHHHGMMGGTTGGGMMCW